MGAFFRTMEPETGGAAGEQYSPLERTLEAAQKLNPPKTITELKHAVLQLTALSHPDALHKDLPPNYIFHIGQVATLTGVMLIDQPEEVQVAGQVLGWSHDIGRVVETGVEHITAGRRILEALHFNGKVAAFTVAHHRWGLGVPKLGGPDNFPQRAREALANGTTEALFTEIRESWGIETLAVLLADNSKEPFMGDGIEQNIIPFTEELGRRLIQNQIDRGRYIPGGPTHEAELTGMKFLCAGVSYIEAYLGINYNPNTIIRAREVWQDERHELIAIWREIAYHTFHDPRQF